MTHLRYLLIVLRHKWFVLVAGLRVGGVPLRRLLLHDASKFGSAEWGPYRRRFASGRAGSADHSADPDEFRRAFEHHWRRNPHHWEYWVVGGGAREMPEAFAREMVADWMGAGRAYTGRWDVRDWYGKNRGRIILHPRTREYVERLVLA